MRVRFLNSFSAQIATFLRGGSLAKEERAKRLSPCVVATSTVEEE